MIGSFNAESILCRIQRHRFALNHLQEFGSKPMLWLPGLVDQDERVRLRGVGHRFQMADRNFEFRQSTQQEPLIPAKRVVAVFAHPLNGGFCGW